MASHELAQSILLRTMGSCARRMDELVFFVPLGKQLAMVREVDGWPLQIQIDRRYRFSLLIHSQH